MDRGYRLAASNFIKRSEAVHRIAIAFIPFIFAASTPSVPVYALDLRDAMTAAFCQVDCRAPPARSNQNGFPKVTGSDPLRIGGVIDFNIVRLDSACTAPRWSAWPVADNSASKVDDTRRRQNRPGADLQRFVADARTPRGFPDGPVAGVHKLENVPIVRDNAGNAPYGEERRNPTGGVEDDRQDTRLSLLQNSPRSVPGTALTRNDSREEQWMRLPDRTIPEPGAWAVLIAGLLGICAVARPRIFSS
jgi:hypothetical protein